MAFCTTPPSFSTCCLTMRVKLARAALKALFAFVLAAFD
jgi:hypothetical protein